MLVGDFGLSRTWDGSAWVHGQPGQGGTPAFSPPERLATGSTPLSFELVCAGDVWAAGVSLHFMLSGTLPFEAAGDVFQVVTSIEKGAVKTAHGLPPLAHSLISSMLRVEPDERPTAASCLAHDWLRGHDGWQPAPVHPADGFVSAAELETALVSLDRAVSVALIQRRFIAAVRIQSVARGRLARRRIHIPSYRKAAGLVQTWFRSWRSQGHKVLLNILVAARRA